MMQEEALTSFALYDLYRTHKSHEKQLTSEMRSCIEYLIPSGNIILIVRHLKLTAKI